MRTKQTIAHEKGCTGLASVERGDWSHPWFLPMGSGPSYPSVVLRRDSICRRLRPGAMGERWAEMVCNDTGCPARLLVAVSDIEQAAHAAAEEEG